MLRERLYDSRLFRKVLERNPVEVALYEVRSKKRFSRWHKRAPDLAPRDLRERYGVSEAGAGFLRSGLKRYLREKSG